MSRAFWGMLFGIALVSGSAAAQEPTPPTTGPVSVTTLPHPQLPDTAPPAVAPGSAFEDCNGPLLQGDPLLEGHAPGSCWFTDAEADFLKPHFVGFLNGPVNFGGGFVDTVELPNAPLDWTVSPRVEIGYRLPGACGEFILGYRNLTSYGDATILNFDPFGNGDLHSRLNLNTLDLDYAQHEAALGPCWDMKWRIGLRLMQEYHDSRAIGLLLEQHATNQFLGVGPHASVELWRHLEWHRVSLYGRLEGAGLLGQVGQSYEESFNFPNGSIGATSRLSTTQGVPIVNFQAGVSWVPWCQRRLQVTAGYQIESWWYLASTNSGARGDLSAQGLFLRGEWGY